MKYFLLGAIGILIASCSNPMREHQMTRMNHNHCNEWVHHDHDDLHGGSYWHTHCMDVHK